MDNQNEGYVLAVTPAQAQLIMQALGELPAKLSMSLIQVIESQTANQEELVERIYQSEHTRRTESSEPEDK